MYTIFFTRIYLLKANVMFHTVITVCVYILTMYMYSNIFYVEITVHSLDGGFATLALPRLFLFYCKRVNKIYESKKKKKKKISDM